MVLLVIGALTSDRFLQGRNIFDILQYAAEPAIIAIGMMFVILARGVELSVGSVMGIGNVIHMHGGGEAPRPLGEERMVRPSSR